MNKEEIESLMAEITDALGKEQDKYKELKKSHDRLKEVLIHCKKDVYWNNDSPNLRWIKRVLKQTP